MSIEAECFFLQALLPRLAPKIPSKLLLDTRPDGALFHVISKFHELMSARGLKRGDFTNPYHRKPVAFVPVPYLFRGDASP